MRSRGGGADMERRDLQLVVERPDRMFVEGLRRRSGISVPQGVSDALRGKAIDIRDTAPLVADIKVGCPVEEPVPMQDRQGASDRTRVTLRDGAIPQELGRVVGPEAEKLREEFEDPLFGRVAAGKPCAALRGCLRIWRHALIVGFRGRGTRQHGMPHRAFPARRREVPADSNKWYACGSFRPLLRNPTAHQT